MKGLTGLLNDPRLSMAAGLLDPRGTYGSFGATLSKGIQGYQQAQQAQALQAMQAQAMAKMKREKEKREKLEQMAKRFAPGGLLGAPGTEATPFEAEMFPGEAPIEGLLTAGQDPTGMYQSNPQMAGLLSEIGQIDPMAAASAMMKPTATSASGIGKLQDDLRAGRITQGQYDQGLAVMMKPLVQQTMGGPAPRAAQMTDQERQEWNIPRDSTAYFDPKTGEPKVVGTGAAAAEKRKKFQELFAATSAVDRYKALLREHGTEQWPGAAKLQLGAAYADVLFEAKELANLGALQAADLDLMERVLRDPTKISSTMYTGEDLLKQMETFDAKLNDAREKAIQMYGLPPGSVRID